jgi:magnesium-transporting ATPase (P-type)
MEYYIVSFFISIVIFIFVYLYDYKSSDNNENQYDNQYENQNESSKSLFSTNNILLFIIIYIVSTIICFYTTTSALSLSGFIPIFLLNLFKPPIQAPPLIKDNGDGDEIDPKILSKITDNLDIGFKPPDNTN